MLDLLQDILANSPGPACLKDTQLNVVAANDAFLALFPADGRNGVIGSFAVSGLAAANAVAVKASDELALDTGGASCVEARSMPDGTTRWFNMQKVRVGSSSEPTYLLVTGLDVSESEETIKRLTESTAHWENFLGRAAHDLHEPLRMVFNFTQLLRAQNADSLDKDSLEFIDISVSAVEQMRRLVDGLHTYARVDDLGSSAGTIDVSETLALVKSNLHDEIKQSGATITSNELPVLTGNPEQFAWVLQKLISNGLKYQPVGSVPHIHLKAQELEYAWKFTVKDDGIGIKQEFFEQIFQPFKRLHSRQHYSGTGVGLATCRRIVEGMGGSIEVRSVPDSGSDFTVSLRK